MTRRRIPPTDTHADEALDLIGRLAAECRTRQRDALAAGETADKAIKANAAAHARLSDAIGVYRALLAALADGGGFERVAPIADVITDARAFLDGGEQCPTP
jgi:hypothetical protein